MTEELQNNQATPQISDKELNFRALENKYKRELENERMARMEAEKKSQELERNRASARDDDDDDDDDEHYIPKKKFKKEQARLSNEIKTSTQQEIKQAVAQAIEKERTDAWLNTNNDFENVMKNADKLVIEHPELAQQLLKMPDNFDRQKLVYYNIKKLGLDKPKQPEKSTQERIDENRRSPYYQPSGVSNSPYTTQGDFSPSGQKAAYDKIQQLKKSLRM